MKKLILITMALTTLIASNSFACLSNGSSIGKNTNPQSVVVVDADGKPIAK